MCVNYPSTHSPCCFAAKIGLDLAIALLGIINCRAEESIWTSRFDNTKTLLWNLNLKFILDNLTLLNCASELILPSAKLGKHT